MRIRATAIEKVTVLDLQGSLLDKVGNTALLDQVSRHIRATIRNLVFNMIECRNADEDGIETLRLCISTAREAGGNIKFVHLSRRMGAQMQDIDNLETFDDQAEAVRSYGHVTHAE